MNLHIWDEIGSGNFSVDICARCKIERITATPDPPLTALSEHRRTVYRFEDGTYTEEKPECYRRGGTR